MSSENNGWNEWSKHVLKELERLNNNYESLRATQEEMKAALSQTVSAMTALDEVRQWKSNMDEVMSPSQLKTLSEDVQSLKNFKITAITIWAVIQALTGFGLAFLFKLF